MSDAQFRTIRLDLHGPIAKVTMWRPDRANRLNAQMCSELRDAFRMVRASSTQVLILTGSSYAFCGGLDDEAHAHPATTDVSQIEGYHQPLISDLRGLPQLVIAAVNGCVAGVGANLALACDIVIAAKCARFSIGEPNRAASLDDNTMALLARALGPSRMLAMTLFGDSIGAEQAAQCGLIWSYVQPESLDREVTIVAQRLAATPSGMLQRAKQQVQASWRRAQSQMPAAEIVTH